MKTSVPFVFCLALAWLSVSAGCSSATVGQGGRVFHVDGAAVAASDVGPGTREKPWKTLDRAGSAKELAPGDTVLIHDGTYRQSMNITVSGAPGRPITFAAAPGECVVIKGSEIIRGDWRQVSAEPSQPEPYPNAYTRVWQIKLGDEYFTDPSRIDFMKDPAKRDVTQIVSSDRLPWTKMGASPEQDEGVLAVGGRTVADLANQRDNTFFYDRKNGLLYVRTGDPRGANLELGVRGDTLLVKQSHDLVIRGLEVRHSRGNMAALAECQRVTVEDCKMTLADFCNLAMYNCKDCLARRCDLSWAANTGFHLQCTKDCTIEDCTLTFNNYRLYAGGWHDGGMKNIPQNVRTTVRRCELAYNFSTAIWFDTANVDIRLLDNVIHHNRGCGIYHELNFGGGIFAGNLIFANGSSGIVIATHYPRYMVKRHWVEEAKEAYAKGDRGWSQGAFEAVAALGGVENIPDNMLWIVHNTLVGNANGIFLEDRYGTWENLQNVRAMDNLLVHNYPAGQTPGYNADMVFQMHADKNDKRLDTSNHTDYNVFGRDPVLKPDFETTRTFAQWQQRFGEDLHSKIMPVQCDIMPTSFRLLTQSGLDIATPLGPEVTNVWKPANPRRVGANMIAWPVSEK